MGKYLSAINETTVRGFRKRYEAQIKDEIRKKKSLKTVLSKDSEDVCVYLEKNRPTRSKVSQRN